MDAMSQMSSGSVSTVRLTALAEDERGDQWMAVGV